MVEYLDVVDEDDRVLDSRPRSECLDEGLLHRAITIFITNSEGEIFIQKRARHVRFYPSLWGPSVGGHVSTGESYSLAANRELKEELGIQCELRELGKFVAPKRETAGGADWEIIAVFAGTLSSTITLSDESEEGRFVSPQELKRIAETQPESLTPDLILAMKYHPSLSSDQTEMHLPSGPQ